MEAKSHVLRNGSGKVRRQVFKRNSHKYGAKKTTCALNHPHPSKLEAAVCAMLQIRERAKEISELKWIAPVDLFYIVAGEQQRVRWKVDFSFIESRSGQTMWAEAKGVETADYKQRKKLWKQGAGPGPLEVWKGNAARPRIVEIVIPKKVTEAVTC